MNKVIIEVSAHHCHISRADLDILYGKNYQLTPVKPLSQTGQFAAEEKVDLKTGLGEIKNLRILGPERESTQIEISQTEAYQLKIKPPVAECTCPDKNNGCVIGEIIGPKGTIKRCAIIIAHRHLHIDPKTAEQLKLTNGQLVSVKTFGQRRITFHDVLVRINPDFQLRLHLDTDEANAAGIIGEETGEIII